MKHVGVSTILLLCLAILSTAGSASAKVIRIYQGKLNVNSASAADFTRLPGVGEVIGFRIVKERERRGQFAALNELLEIKGISPRIYGGFKDYLALKGESNLLVHIDLNTVTKPILLGLPGMSAGEARSILNYRKAKGGFSAVEDLLQVPGINDKRLQELSEWLTVARQRR